MNSTQILTELRKAAADREHADVLRRAHAARIRELIRDGHDAGISPTELAQAAAVSRQAVYDVLRQSPGLRG
jgi:DNA invertase Pin-like site-specific DNA recombinase